VIAQRAQDGFYGSGFHVKNVAAACQSSTTAAVLPHVKRSFLCGGSLLSKANRDLPEENRVLSAKESALLNGNHMAAHRARTAISLSRWRLAS
jgi:hypothetical protein